MSTICITGGTTGIGYEAALQLARGVRYDKIIITSRTEASAKEAIGKLVTESNQPETKFDFVLLDLNCISSCTACAESLPNDLNAIVLNAGQMAAKGYADVNPKTGLTLTWTETVLGHSILITLMLEKKKFAKGARVIYSGSEGEQQSHACAYPLSYSPSLLLSHPNPLSPSHKEYLGLHWTAAYSQVQS